MQYKSRRLLRIVSIVLGTLILSVFIGIAALALTREDTRAAEGWVCVILLLLPGLFVAKLITDSFSALEIDEDGVQFVKLVGRKAINWGDIASVRYWETIQRVHGASSREYFIELAGSDGKRLLRLKSTFEREAYTYLMEQARSRGIRVDA
jgi:hypothetical protein